MTENFTPAALLVAIAQAAAADIDVATALVEQAEALGLDETHADAFANAVAGDLDRTIAAL